MRIDFDAINRGALAVFPALLKQWLPEGRRVGSEWVARNPRRDDRRSGSFRINLDTGKWSDFATGDRGGDPISLLAYLNGDQQSEAARGLARTLGLPMSSDRPEDLLTGDEIANHRAASHNEWRPITPVPADAPDISAVALSRAKPGYDYTASWRYLNSKGELLGYVARFDRPANGVAADKEVVPFTFCLGPGGNRRWRKKSWTEPRPLYGLDSLAQRLEAPVLIVEGEKTVDAARKLFSDYAVITSPGGSNAAEKADWSSLEGRRVTIWPDNDAPGMGYAEDVARLASDAGALSIATVQVPSGFPPKWDLADPPPLGTSLGMLSKLLADAKAANGDWPKPTPIGSSLPPVKPFAPGMLPSSIENFVYDVADRQQSAPDYVAIASLCGIAAVVGNRIRIAPKQHDDWVEVPNLWGPTSARPAQ